MARAITAALLILTMAVRPAMADDEVTDETPEVTQEVPVPVENVHRAFMRLTYYTYNSGRTANGERVYIGGTACSTNFHFGDRFQLADGSVVRCNDRGQLYFDPSIYDGWLDIYGRSDIRSGSGWVTLLQ